MARVLRLIFEYGWLSGEKLQVGLNRLSQVSMVHRLQRAGLSSDAVGDGLTLFVFRSEPLRWLRERILNRASSSDAFHLCVRSLDSCVWFEGRTLLACPHFLQAGPFWVLTVPGGGDWIFLP